MDRAAWLAIRETGYHTGDNGRPMRSVLLYDAAHEGAKKNIEQAERVLKGLQVRQQKQGRYSPGLRRRYSEMSIGFELARDNIIRIS